MTDKPVALVTGGSRGIGRAICVELARSGYYLIVNYQSRDDAADETIELIRQVGGDGEKLKLDVTDADACAAELKELTKRLPNIEVLVNNAGIARDGLFAMLSSDAWNSVIDASLNGFFNVTKPILRKMMRNHSGSIVTISSVSGQIGNRGQTNYSAAKAGLIAASKALASETARLGIRVNIVAPGLIDTDMIEKAPVEIIKQLIPMERIGKPEEVARVVRFLCSEDASYITGSVISVNGGMH